MRGFAGFGSLWAVSERPAFFLVNDDMEFSAPCCWFLVFRVVSPKLQPSHEIATSEAAISLNSRAKRFSHLVLHPTS